jgi:alanine dehydrogenase
MDIGIPLELSDEERRVAMSPAGTHQLVSAGHRVYVQRGAGVASHFTDEEYEQAGAALVYSGEEAFGRGDLVLKVGTPTPEEYGFLQERQILFCFLRPVVIPKSGFDALVERRVAAVAMELIENGHGRRPVLDAISEIAGPMAIHVAADLLRSGVGGRGILLAGAPGVAPASIVILGAGAVGTTAARTAIGVGAQVLVLDIDRARLRRIGDLTWSRVTTLTADEYHIAKAVRFADVLICCAAARAERTPHLITEAMVRSMKPGAVILDLSIDQGGCIENGRPTTLDHPTYIRHGVVHYAVPNMTADVARTATQALSNTVLPYILETANRGLAATCAADPGLARGLVTAGGHCFQPTIASHFGIEAADPSAMSAALGETPVHG